MIEEFKNYFKEDYFRVIAASFGVLLWIFVIITAMTLQSWFFVWLIIFGTLLFGAITFAVIAENRTFRRRLRR